MQKTILLKAIKINSLPINDVLSNMAEALGVPLERKCEEYFVQIPSSLGKGTIKGFNFSNGLGFIRYDCTFIKDFEIQFVKTDVHPLRFIYTLHGSIGHRFANEDVIHIIQKFQNVIVASERNNGHALSFSAGENTVLSSIEIRRSEFKSKTECEIESMDSEFQKLLTDVEAKRQFVYEGLYSLHISEMFKEMENFNEQDFLNKLFIEGKVYEIIALQILQYQDDLKDVGNRSLLRRYEVEQIERAAEMVKQDIINFHNIEEISKEVGLNANKLQQGFQDLYSHTVNGYVNKVRLDLAQNLLLNTELSLAEIVDRIGLINKSYFSKIFKEKYGIPPSKFRQNNGRSHDSSHSK
ncbi:helix-turn-helix domain-containing protein [Autumnicola edwardsiae]|uniref:Helix-turn-helix transcriptional regulator n=1 Tax=Autumnicola edwardsiae TaxID=3075594 RepID=A0ABU3CU62_9FLAO|nr:helix-turn-helix transcriptional regulator [Zunongwangia sp. F297]MDT0649880.1 helix-turn-helix transcriptional regulator [Zunongwangia sp. F297]